MTGSPPPLPELTSVIAGIIRAVLPLAAYFGGLAVSDSQIATIAGILAMVISAVWSYLHKVKVARQIHDALMEPPPETRDKLMQPPYTLS